MLLNSYLLKRKQKEKNLLLYFAIHRRNEGVVTYGIRARFDPRLGVHYGCFNYRRRVGRFTFDLRIGTVMSCVFPLFLAYLPLYSGTAMSCAIHFVLGV